MRKRVCIVYTFQRSFHFCILPLVVGQSGNQEGEKSLSQTPSINIQITHFGTGLLQPIKEIIVIFFRQFTWCSNCHWVSYSFLLQFYNLPSSFFYVLSSTSLLFANCLSFSGCLFVFWKFWNAFAPHVFQSSAHPAHPTEQHDNWQVCSVGGGKMKKSWSICEEGRRMRSFCEQEGNDSDTRKGGGGGGGGGGGWKSLFLLTTS